MKSTQRVTKRLADVAEVVTGSTPSTSCPEYYGGEIPFVGPSDLGNTEPILTAPKTLTPVGAKQARVLPEGAVLVCCIGATIGKIGIAGRPLATNQQINALAFDERVIWPRYGFYFCMTLESAIRGLGSSTTLPILPKSRFQELLISFPHMEEQRRIADILDKADAIRRKRKQAIALTDQLLRSTFLEMFGDPVTNPKGWQEATIGELCESGGSIVDGPFGSFLKPEHYTSSGVRVIRNWNIRDDFFDESDFRYVDLLKFEEIRRSEVVAGDILITTKGTVGDICMMPPLAGESVLSASGTVRLRLPPTGVLLAPFVVWQMVLPSYKQYLHSFEAGSAQQYLNLSAIRKMRLLIPPADDQQRFCDLRLRVLGIKQKQETAQRDASSLFTSLADRVFRGDLSRDRDVEGQLSMFNK